MGWSSGTHVMSDIINVIDKRVKDKKLCQNIYVDFIKVFENSDCDNLTELEGESENFDAALRISYKDYYDEQDREEELNGR